MTTTAAPAYRSDIDGLRAVAVLAVVLFHAFPSVLPGGFAGVDVFFVISGFLISRLILAGFRERTFSLVDFYARRVNRIVPALLLVLAVSMVFGAADLLSDEYEELGRHVAGGAAFVANFVFLGSIDYFAPYASVRPLLHLWSLSIEEQFYLIWPPLLWLAWSLGWSVPRCIALLATCSFVLCLWTAAGNPEFAFFMPQTRFWELLIGAGLAAAGPAQAVRSNIANPCSFAGIALILVAFAAGGEVHAHLWAVPATAGAAMLIVAGPATWFNRRVLATRPLVRIGLISYPLYLWHWPILVFGAMYTGQTLGAGWRSAAVGASFTLAWLTWRFVEIPARASGHRPAKAWAFLVALWAVGGAGIWAMQTNGMDGFAFRQSARNDFAKYFNDSVPEHRYYFQTGMDKAYRDECNFYRVGGTDRRPKQAIASSCYERDPSRPHSVFLWGDSHAQHLGPGLRAHLPAQWQVLQVATSGCDPDTGGSGPSANDSCKQSNWFALQKIAAVQPDAVIVAQCCRHAPAQLDKIVKQLAALGIRKVIFTGPLPHWEPSLPRLMARRLWLEKPERTFVGTQEAIFRRNEELVRNFKPPPPAILVDLAGFFCNPQGCLTRVGDDLRTSITTWDAAHLTPAASGYLAKNLLVDIVIRPTDVFAERGTRRPAPS